MDHTSHDHEAFLRATQPLWDHHPVIIRKPPMPISTAITSTLFLSFCGLMAPAAAVVVRHPAGTDMYAIIGAMLASAISLIYALRKEHSVGLIISVIISAAIIGGIGPGALLDLAVLCGWLQQTTAETLSWRLYALAGFVLGLGGWAIVQAIHRLMQAAAERAERLALRKYINRDEPPITKP